MDPLLIISFKSFDSIWYWIMTGVGWSMMCHWTIGVPYDALVRADHRGGAYAVRAETLALVNAARLTDAIGNGVIATALAFFLLAILATFGFAYNYELAQALFVLLAPLTLVFALNVRLARRIMRQEPRGAVLRKLLLRRRFWNQVIGLSSIMVAVMFAFYMAAMNTAWGNW